HLPIVAVARPPPARCLSAVTSARDDGGSASKPPPRAPQAGSSVSQPPPKVPSAPPSSWWPAPDERSSIPPSREGVARERGGVLLRLGEGEEAALAFVPAEVARRLTTLSSFLSVPGTQPPASGIALADGAVVTVLRVGDAEARSTVGRPAYAPGEDWLVPGADRAVL